MTTMITIEKGTRWKSSKPNKRPDYDVRVTPTNGSLQIRFRQSSHEKITHTGYIQLMLDKNQLYMKQSDKEHGYLVSLEQPTVNGTIRGQLHSRNIYLFEWAKKK